jgi:hypothetical protein
MNINRRLALVAVMIGAAAVAAQAQQVISAHSGTLHYFEGAVAIDGTSIEQKAAKFNQLKENAVLSTAMGRAEVLLTPGVFLRVGENSSVKMLDNRLASTRVELLSGTVMVESDDPEVSVKNPAVTILYKDYEIQPVKFGLFEIDTKTGELKVFKGQANVAAGGMRAVIKDGRKMPFSAALLSEKFDAKDADDLYLWTRDRSAYISAANMSTSRTLASGLMSNSSYGAWDSMARMGGSGRWFYNGFLGTYTYLPYSGMVMNPFGYGFYNPYSIYLYYSPSQYYWNGGGSARTGGSTGVPLTNIGTSSVAAQISRIGSGVNTHPTLGSPVRASNGSSASASYRNGFAGPTTFNGNNSASMYNPALSAPSSAPVSSPMSAGAAGRFGGGAAPAPAPSSGGGVAAPAGGSRSK